MKRLIQFLLVLLGFGVVATSCEEEQEVMYGTAWVKYHISARVVDTEGNPIEGIEAKGILDPSITNRGVDMGITDSDGLLDDVVMSTEYPNYLLLTDTDGEANGGEFAEKLVDISDSYVRTNYEEFHKKGSHKLELGDITLEKR